MAKLSGLDYSTGWTLTYYDPAKGGINTDGDPTTTATGPFKYFVSAAVDDTNNKKLDLEKGQIPYGTILHVHVPNHPEYDQLWLAADTGGGIKGKHLDLGMPASAGFGKEYNGQVAVVVVGEGVADAKNKAQNWEKVINTLKSTIGDIGSAFGKVTGNNSGSLQKGDSSLTSTIGEAFQYTNPSAILGKSPSVEDDDYPEHRFASNPFVLRIGDSQFFIPPLNIKTSKVTMIDGQHTIRSKSMTMIKSGNTTQRLDIRLVFGDTEQINGFKVPAPGNKHYYMDGLRALLAQFYRNPFLPVRNELINTRHGIYNVALENINIMTDPDIPNMVICDLSLIECTVEPYIQLPDFMYDHLFNYPLWRWYYHQMLFEDKTQRRSDMYLRPVSKFMDDATFFRVLSPDEIEKMETDVVEQARRAANENGDLNYYLNPKYILGKFPMVDVQKIMEDWDIGGAICTGVQIGISKELTPFHLEEYETPVFQDIGGVTRIFIMDFYCTNRDELESLQSLVKHAEMTAREYRHRFAGGFVAVHHELVNLAGIEYAMPINIETQTVEGVDDNYIVSISFQEFNVNQKDNERLNGVQYNLQKYANDMSDEFDGIMAFADVFEFQSKRNYKPEIIYENFVEESLAQLVLYPDLELPSIEDLNSTIKTINAFRKKRGQSEMPLSEYPIRPDANTYWAEPDFYFVYPKVEDAYETIGLGDYGMKMANLINNARHDDPNSYKDIISDTDGIQITEVLDSFSSRFVDNSSSSYFDSQQKLSQVVNLDLDYTIAAKTHTLPAFTDWNENTEIPDVEEIVPMMLYDHVRYDNRYRMTQAFPSYLFLIVDEGRWVDGRKLWNNHYAYHAVHEISIVRDKDNPVDLAYITLANTYGTFNQSSKMTDPRKYQDTIARGTDRLLELWDSFFLAAEDVMATRYNLMDSATLKEGARIHVRLGYSSNAANLPICFNGHIASVNEGPIVEIVAQGDGVELINQVISANPGEGSPNEPHNGFMKYLTARQSNYWFSASSQFNFFNNFESRYGIEHFGYVESLAEDGTDGGPQAVGGFFGDLTKYAVFGGTHILAGITWSDHLNSLAEDDTKLLTIARQAGEFVTTHVAQFFDGILVDNATWIASKITGIPNFNVYDVMKNIYRGSLQPKTGVINYKNDAWTKDGIGGFFGTLWDAHNVFDGEKNVNFSVYNKTVWDIGQQYSLFVPEFICSPHYHGLRSTLFFGMPHWPVKYAYIKEKGKDSLNIKSYVEAYKPFQQMHTFATGTDIIKNDIKANSEHIKHVVTGMYYRGDINTIKEGLTVYADRSIIASEQKSMILDTGVYQDLFGPDAIIEFVMRFVVKNVAVGVTAAADLALTLLEGMANGLDTLVGWTGVEIFEDIGKAIGKVNDMVDPDAVDQFFREVAQPGKYGALSVAIGSLQRNFMDMYQGELILFGRSAVKPWDLFHLNDTNFNMSGTAQVGKVTHTLSRSSGFTTVIKPDLVVGRTDGHGGRNLVLQTVTAVGTAITMAVARRVIGSKVFRKIMRSGFLGTMGSLQALGKASSWAVAGDRGKKTAQTFFERVKNWTVENEKMGKLWTMGKNVVKGNLFFTLLTGTIGELLMSWYDKETKYNNVIYIYPLWKGGEPFAAGIRGAAHIIPGYIDPRYADPLGIGLADGNVGMSSPMGSTLPYANEVVHPLLQPGRLTSHFGWRPEFNAYHYGTDFGQFFDAKGNKVPTKVYAIADGVVEYNGYGANGEGNWIRIKHNINGQEYISAYKHFDSKPNLAVGTQVKMGQFINYIGNSGSSTAPHLHFEIQKGSTYDYGSQMNPVNFFKQMGVPLE